MIDSYYLKLININDNNSLVEAVKIIDAFKEELEHMSVDVTCCCKIITNILNNYFNAKRIKNKIVNTRTLNACYEHEFIICFINNGREVNSLLVDLTYEQFLKKEKILNSKFSEWPSEILMKNNRHELLNDLLLRGYSIINDEDYNIYLASLIGDHDPYFLEDIMLSRNLNKAKR